MRLKCLLVLVLFTGKNAVALTVLVLVEVGKITTMA